jgi:hypothetical protein
MPLPLPLLTGLGLLLVMMAMKQVLLLVPLKGRVLGMMSCMLLLVPSLCQHGDRALQHSTAGGG